MTDAPHRPLVTLSRMSRKSATVVALQFAAGASLAFALAAAISRLIYGENAFTSYGEDDNLLIQAAMVAAVFLGLFIANVAGLATWRLLAYAHTRFRRRS